MKKSFGGSAVLAVIIGAAVLCIIVIAVTGRINTGNPNAESIATEDEVNQNSDNTISEADSDETYVSQVLTLEEEEGELVIYNDSGRELDLRAGSRLYEGYEIYTGDGYAWVLLDDNGVLKLDVDTHIIIQKTGNSLEIFLVEGELFFNITESFAENEDFSIETSTMKTGISGTSGIISTRTLIDSSTEFSIKLLEGKVELTYLISNATDMYLAELLEAGQRFKLTWGEEDEEDILISSLTDLTVSDVNGFVAVEIRVSEELQEKILSGNSIIDQEMIEEIINGADQKLEEDETAKREAKEEASLEEIGDEDDSTTDDSATEDNVTDDSTVENSVTDDSTEDDDIAEDVIEITIFYYAINDNGLIEIFASQKVMSDEIPFMPYFQPSARGAWCQVVDGQYVEYDFTTSLSSNTSLVWVSTGV